MRNWTTLDLWIEGGAFLVAALADFAWKRWSRPRWERWVRPRATEIDAVKVQAMCDGVLKKDQRFIDVYLARAGSAVET